MVYLLFKKSEGAPEEPVESHNPDTSESSPSLGHRVTLFTTNHAENGTAFEDPTRIVLPVSLGHPAGTGTAAGKWQQRRAVNIAFDLPDSGAKIPSGPIQDFWTASTPTAEHLNAARRQQQIGGISSRLARKQMEGNIGSYVTPENVHDKLSSAVDAIKDENSAIQRVGMACYEDLSDENKFCHRRIIAKGLSDKLGVPIPDIFHIRELQKETNNTDQPLKYFEDTILHPMRAIADRQGLDLSKDKDVLQGIFQKEIPAFSRLNQIISHWDSQKEEPFAPASVPGAPIASPGVKEGIKGDITNPDFQKSNGYNMIVNTCNTVLNSAGVPVMGAGIAKDFRDKYKHTDYLDAVGRYLDPRNMTVAAGSVFVHQPRKADGTPFGPPIASLFVKRHFGDQARRDDTSGAITALKEYLDNNPSPDGKPWKVAMPHISGLNGERGNPVAGSVGETGGWSATRQHIIDTFNGSPHEAHIIDFDGGAQSAPSDTTDRMDVNGVHTYGTYQTTSQTWKPIFSNFSNISIPFKISSLKNDGTRQETSVYGKSVETIYQAAKLLKDQNGNITPLGVRIIEGKIKGLPGTERMGENPTSKDVKDFVENLQGKNPELFDPEFDEKKIDIMRRVLTMKARYSKEFREQLVTTGNMDIVESTGLRNDIFWGASNVGRRDGLQSGQNVLGKLLMELRNQLISQMQQDTQSQSQETTPQISLQTPEDYLVDLKTHLQNKNSIHSKLYSTAQLAGDGTTVLLPKQALQQFTNREGQNFSRLISTPEGIFVELKGISGKTKEVSERERETLNNQADGRNFYTRSAPHGTRSTVVFYQNSQSRDGFRSGFWYAPAGDYFAER